MFAKTGGNASGWGLFLLRLAVGLIFVAHGAQKLFGAFGGTGLTGFSHMLAGLGFKPALAWAVVVAVVEFLGGLFLILGILTKVAASLIAINMAVAIVFVHLPKGFFVSKGGCEYALVLFAAAFALALLGPGNSALKK